MCWTVKFHSFVVGIEKVLLTTMKGCSKLKLYTDIFYRAENKKGSLAADVISSEIWQASFECKL